MACYRVDVTDGKEKRYLVLEAPDVVFAYMSARSRISGTKWRVDADWLKANQDAFC
jgi:hypothetical protein